MSRAEQWLTLAQLVPAWASELADASLSPSQLERDLWQCLHQDATIGFSIIADRLGTAAAWAWASSTTTADSGT
jgi:hypothetical protein